MSMSPDPTSTVSTVPTQTDPTGTDPTPADAPATPTDGAAASHSHHGYISNKDAYLKRLKRIEGQARGLQNMVDDEKYCIDILTQISAMTSALESVALGLLEDHLSHCVVEAVAEGGDVAEAKLKEATAAIARLVKS
jgi:DNA-binding FrmR family transcriptional regulator